MTPGKLRASENAILDALEHQARDCTFLGRLYRDGVPTPESYLSQRVRVLFAFREPNMGGKAYARDMRDEVSDVYFRPRKHDGSRPERSQRGWWNWKAGMFAHAAAAALKEEPWRDAFARFTNGGWNHEVVNQFGYVQIKKVGGGGTAKAEEICAHAVKYAKTLKQQVDLYRPHLILGCGVGRDSPAKLLAAHVVLGGREAVTSRTGATWWEYPPDTLPRALMQLWHPARRGSKSELYEDVWSSVDEVARHCEWISK